MRAQIAFDLRRGSDVPPLLLRAARRLEPLDAELARETYLEALLAAIYAAGLAKGTTWPAWARQPVRRRWDPSLSGPGSCSGSGWPRV